MSDDAVKLVCITAFAIAVVMASAISGHWGAMWLLALIFFIT